MIQTATTSDRNTDINMIKIFLQEYVDRPNTLISYSSAIEKFVLWLFSQNLVLNQVTREIIQGYQLFLLDPQPSEMWCGQARPKSHPEWKPFQRGLSPSSANLQILILKTLYQYLVDYGYLTRNPFRLIRKKITYRQPTIERFLNKKEWKYLVRHLKFLPKYPNKNEIYHHERNRWIFDLLYFTGCRRAEIINARMSDFIFQRGQWWLKVVGKGSKPGQIPVTNELLSSLIRYRRFMGLTEYPSPSETDIPILCSRHGHLRPLTDSAIYKIIKKICNKIADDLKIKDPSSSYVFRQVSTHWLRHTSATHQVDAGIDIRTVKKNLRHELLETTMRYQHVESEHQHYETTTKFDKFVNKFK